MEPRKAAPQAVKKLGELERAGALSNFNRAQRRVRREGCLPFGQASRFATGKAKSKISVCRRRGDFCGGKSHFPKQNSFPGSFCARKSERFQQKLVGVVGRLKTQRVFRFCLWQNCHGSNRRFEARHLAGELAPPSTPPCRPDAVWCGAPNRRPAQRKPVWRTAEDTRRISCSPCKR